MAARIVCGLRNGVTLLIVAILGALAAVAVVDALRSSPAPSAAATAPATTTSPGAPTFTSRFPFGSKRRDIEEIGNTWAALYAAGDRKACTYMGEGLCALKPLPRFPASFEGATIKDIHFLKNYDAAASFSNGITVEFFGDGGTWTIIRVVAELH
jgi:hypothetical protein